MVVDLRGSLGFGEEALQSLPGKAGSQVLILNPDLLCKLRFVHFFQEHLNSHKIL